MNKKIEKIERYLKKRKIQQRSLSILMGYNPTYVNRVLRGVESGAPQFFKLIIFTLKEISREKITEAHKTIVGHEKDLEELEEISREK